MMDLSAVETIDLINELEKRNGVKKISVGLYKEYRLTKKYSDDPQRSIKADVVLVIDHVEKEKAALKVQVPEQLTEEQLQQVIEFWSTLNKSNIDAIFTKFNR